MESKQHSSITGESSRLDDVSEAGAVGEAFVPAMEHNRTVIESLEAFVNADNWRVIEQALEFKVRSHGNGAARCLEELRRARDRALATMNGVLS